MTLRGKSESRREDLRCYAGAHGLLTYYLYVTYLPIICQKQFILANLPALIFLSTVSQVADY